MLEEDESDNFRDTRKFREFRQKLSLYFSLRELKGLAFDLGIDWEVLPGEEKSEKIVEMILYVVRHSQVRELVNLVEKQRPKVNWRAILEKHELRELIELVEKQKPKIDWQPILEEQADTDNWPVIKTLLKFDYSVVGVTEEGQTLSSDGHAEISIPIKMDEYYDEGMTLVEAVSSSVDHFHTFEMEKKGIWSSISSLTVSISNLTHTSEDDESLEEEDE